ncbi:TPA: hypothetical protein DIV55_04705 [Patescibacteria group bacterium]|uniref:Glycosyltransferase RgtA/B/C/D-like domain-containing protein n=1 Tax=Candidatus Gottesmanbacteria bacterium GW2011_GWA1_43_11 TaxID=1618436 RepID=A0A0G1CK51_9BACT|nr:MAG: hypothetical protein UV59_C0004G0010 [Candidatus Gottesmanbacteria bacterium GW2011_GWA1_43_11]HCS79013.1 hypothetical protein [Patescibacteria group bacterium]
MQKRTLVILLIILAVAVFLRFYRLATLPPSLEWDEVATGYDANSILKTGRDQYGNWLPLTFRSIDDYKPPLYTYLTTVSIAVWGWNDFAVRFPAALLGALAIVTTYGMTYALFASQPVALLTAFFLAVSPWHVGFSRLALETNSTIFFMTAGTWAFLLGRKKGMYLPIAALFFGLNLFLYHNARVFVPLFGFGLLLLFWKDIWQQKKYAIASAVITFLFLVRLIPIVTSIEGQMRFQGTSIFTPALTQEMAARKVNYGTWLSDDQLANTGSIGKLFHNQYVFYGLLILKNYLVHFDPSFWLFTNDYVRHHVSEMGILYFIDLPLLLLGWYFLLRNANRKITLLLILWFLLAPIPAAVTRDVPHALRTEIMLPVFQMVIAWASVTLYSRFKRRLLLRQVFVGVLILLYVINISFFLHQYFVHFAKDTSRGWQYGRREAAQFAESIKENFDQIIVSTELEQPHVFFLYYLKYDPARYLSEGGTVSGGWAEQGNHFDKYYFRRFDYDQEKTSRRLFIGLPTDFPTHAVPVERIKYLNGQDAIWIVPG